MTHIRCRLILFYSPVEDFELVTDTGLKIPPRSSSFYFSRSMTLITKTPNQNSIYKTGPSPSWAMAGAGGGEVRRHRLRLGRLEEDANSIALPLRQNALSLKITPEICGAQVLCGFG